MLWSHNTRNSMKLRLGCFLFFKKFNNLQGFIICNPWVFLCVCFLILFFWKGGWISCRPTLELFLRSGIYLSFNLIVFKISLAELHHLDFLAFQLRWVIFGHHHTYNVCNFLFTWAFMTLAGLSSIWKLASGSFSFSDFSLSCFSFSPSSVSIFSSSFSFFSSSCHKKSPILISNSLKFSWTTPSSFISC